MNLKANMKTRRKVGDHMSPLKESIMMEQELLHDAKIEWFVEVQKMSDVLKDLGKHLEATCQIYQNMESLQANIEEIEEWNNLEKNFPGGLLVIKAYDIRLHTFSTNEFQEISSKFEERVNQSIVGIMKVYKHNVQDMHEDIQWSKINLQSGQPVPFAFFQKIEDEYEAIKVEVLAGEVISKEYIQESLIRTPKEVTKFYSFIRKFKEEMEDFKDCHLSLDIKKEYVFNAREQRIISQHEAWSKYMQCKEG